MAGGTFVTQNKVRPGAYINFSTTSTSNAEVSNSGIVTIPLDLDWGPVQEVVEIDADSDIQSIFGQSQIEYITQILKRAVTVLAYRLAGGVKATITSGDLTITAAYEGSRGNKFTVVIEEDVDSSGYYNVYTYLDGELVSEQLVDTIDNLVDNDYVVFSGTGALVESAGLVLTGGSDTAVVTQDYLDYMTAIEVEEWDTMAVPTSDSTIKSAVASFIERMRDDEGNYVQAVLADYATADYEGIISVKNGVVLSDGTEISNVDATAWVSGATAGAAVNESNTYTSYDDAISVDTKYTNSEIIIALNNGEFLFIEFDGGVVVEQDINTFTSFTADKSKIYAKNRVVRTMDTIGNDIKNLYNGYYLGKVDNTEDGRNLFKADVISYFESLEAIGAIQNFGSEDVTIAAGTDSDATTLDVAVQPVDSMEKLYMSVSLS